MARAASKPTKRPAKRPASLPAEHLRAFLDPGCRHAMIAEAAYYRSQQRSFESGHEVEDWLAAELKIDSELTGTAMLPASKDPASL